MTPNRPSHAYALFARRPIVPQPPDVLAADPPAGQEPLPPSGTEDTPVTEWQQIRHRRHQRQRIFANGVDQETEPDAAIPPKNGRT